MAVELGSLRLDRLHHMAGHDPGDDAWSPNGPQPRALDCSLDRVPAALSPDPRRTAARRPARTAPVCTCTSCHTGLANPGRHRWREHGPNETSATLDMRRPPYMHRAWITHPPVRRSPHRRTCQERRRLAAFRASMGVRTMPETGGRGSYRHASSRRIRVRAIAWARSSSRARRRGSAR